MCYTHLRSIVHFEDSRGGKEGGREGEADHDLLLQREGRLHPMSTRDFRERPNDRRHFWSHGRSIDHW